MRLVYVLLSLVATAAAMLPLAGAGSPGAARRLRVAVSPVMPPPGFVMGAASALDQPAPDPGVLHQVLDESVLVARMRALERPIFTQINEIRREHGLPPLEPSPQLAAAARAHARSLALAGQFRHEWPDGTPFGRWMQRFYPVAGSHTWSVGENLLWSSGSINAKQAVAMWLASPPHRRIIFTRDWRQLGIGVVAAQQARGAYGGQNVLIVSADFGARSW